MPDPDGTSGRPWLLETPSGGSEFTAYRDETLDPPALVVRVGKTELRYHLRCVDDLRVMLLERGDWVPLGSADEQKPAGEGTSRPGLPPRTIRSAVGTGSRKVSAGGSPTSYHR